MINKFTKFVSAAFLLSLLSIDVNAQPIPELLHYQFDGTGTTVPNLASAPPAGTTTATIMGALTQGAGGQCQGAIIGSGNSSSTDYVNTGYAPNLTGSSWTISMYTKDITPSATLFYIFGDLNSGSFRCFTNGVAGPNNWILRGGLTDVYVNGGATVAPHVTTFVYDITLGNIKGYLDGVLVTTVAQGAVTINGTGPLKVIGYNTNVGAPAGGKLDEFRLYNRALSDAEVALLAGPSDSYSTFSVSSCVSYTVPSGDTTYTASGTYTDTIPAIFGCADSIMTINVTINPMPPVGANASASAVCDGSPVTLYGGGAVSYVWSGGVTDNVAFTPTATDTYTVTGTDANGCTDTDVYTITVNPLPTVTANATTTAVCDGSSVTLSGSGATSYAWSGSVTDNMAFTPTATDTYTVTGTDGNGCENTDMITVTVNTLPTVAANTTASAVCDGSSVTLNGSGATSYAWSGSVTDNVAFTPTATDTYTVTGTDGNGCEDTDMVTVTVNALPSVSLTLGTDLVCVSDASVTLSGESPAGGTWTGTAVTGNTFDPGTAGIGTYGITYSYTDINGCSAVAVDSMVVDACLGIASTENTVFSVYPNPTEGEFMINFNTASSEALVEITNALGEIVNTFRTSSMTSNVDLKEMANGVYFVKVTAGDSISTSRITKR